MERIANIRKLFKYGLGTEDNGDGYKSSFYSFCGDRWEQSNCTRHCRAMGSVRVGGNGIVGGALKVGMECNILMSDAEVPQSTCGPRERYEMSEVLLDDLTP